ncbi:hypothetical protein FQN57_004537 [Myotisia sp. PD_48]|nr:hypothetical protein FQN57_004537 [Myotisia sp. PD_48]
MGFSTPYSPTAFSTPDKSRSISSNVSTTPAGRPPAFSFTPQVPPPSSYYGSSGVGNGSSLNFADSRLGQSTDSQSEHDLLSFSTASSIPGQSRHSLSQRSDGSPLGSQFRSILSKGKGQRSPFSSGRHLRHLRGGQSVTQNGFESPDSQMEWSSNTNPASVDAPVFQPTKLGQQPLTQKPLIYTNPTHAKRAKLDESWVQSEPQNPPPPVQQPKKNSSYPAIVRDIVARASLAPVEEDSDLLLSMEDIMCRMYDKVRDHNSDDELVDFALSEICDELSNLWKDYSPGFMGQEGVSHFEGIGPGDSAPGIMKAIFLSSLLLRLHHPPLSNSKNKNGVSTASWHGTFGGSMALGQTKVKAPMPKVLFSWIWRYHEVEDQKLNHFENIQSNSTASATFWEFIIDSIMRAKFDRVIQVLEEADFRYARTALEDGQDQPGYTGTQLQKVQQCVNKAIQLLKSSPAVRNDDWDIKGVEWTMFRKQLQSAILDLEDMAEGSDRSQSENGDPFMALNFGIARQKPSNLSFSQSARMAESRVPWSVYQNLMTLYKIMMGDTETILKRSEDWLEATIMLTAWWDGDDDSEIAVGVKSPPKRRSQLPRSVDCNTEESYLRRLNYSFTCVTDTLGQDGFQINSMNACEVGLASVCEGSVESVLKLLETWSLPVSAVTAEVAGFGGWMSTAAGTEPMGDLNENDLMVLGYGQQPEKPLSKDDILVDFANGIFSRGRLQGSSDSREGWEVSLEVLGRLDDPALMKKKVGELLDQVPLDTADQMDKVVLLCDDVGFSEEGRRVSERFGDKVAEESEDYGTALLCYGRAHCSRKIKNVVDLLSSFCLIQSRAYPPKDKLDEQLRSLLYEPATALAAIAAVDSEAASILQFYFSSYATLRQYYEIRDEEVNLVSGEHPKHRPSARKREAAEALTAVIHSAADSIYGGLYDQDRESAAQVDGLLILLGEALALLDPDPNRFLTVKQQLTILAAVEDLQTVTSRVYDQCETCLQSALYHARHYSDINDMTGASNSFTDVGSAASFATQGSFFFPGSPQKLLKKSISSTTAISGFSLIGSEMLETQGRPRDLGESGVLIPRPNKGKDLQHPRKDKRNMTGKDEHVRRGWDWRATAPDGVKGVDILKKLRLLLAKGLAFGALGGA